MHPIAARAINGTEPIADLVRDFYGPGGPLSEAGWDVRDSQREMSLRFAEQIDLAAVALASDYDGDESGVSVGLIEAPTGTGKGMAYLLPGFLAALRAAAQFEGSATPQRHPAKLMVSTANIALQAQLIRKDIPALGEMLGVKPRATLMKSRKNYVCRERFAVEAGSMFADQNPALQDLKRWVQSPSCDGDRESYPGEASEVWDRVSVGSDECGRQACPHYADDGGVPVCFWRLATRAWPSAHVIVGNHHWVALSAGIRVLAYAVDEAHELESALRGVQERKLSSSTFLTAGNRGAKVIGADVKDVDRRMAEIVEALLGRAERYLDDKLGCPQESDLKYRSPVPLVPGWLSVAEQDRLAPMHAALRNFRDKVLDAAMVHACNHLIEGQVQTIAKRDDEGAKEARKAGVAANKLIELCRVFGAVALGRPHPDWPTQRSPWAIWAQRERDGRDQWRLVVSLAPADVAPAFAGMVGKNRVMVLASATLPEFGSMRLTLGLGARWEGTEPPPWPEIFATSTGRLAGKFSPRPPGQAAAANDQAGEVCQPADGDDEPTSTSMATTEDLAPAPAYERRLPSPYPLARMGVLVVPQGPDPKDGAWGTWAVQQVVRAVTQSRGGALVLATSNAMMNRYATALREAGRFRVIKQGEQGRSRTISAFRDDVDSVLVATRSFFQGLDVQGDSCRLVVIDRIPFASPEDPLEGAVGRLLVERALATDPRARGASAWAIRSIPQAAMVLVQGIGRLIRSQADRGAVLLLDGRILAPGDGWRVLREALPPFPVSRDVADVGRVLAGAKLEGALPPPRQARPASSSNAIGIDF